MIKKQSNNGFIFLEILIAVGLISVVFIMLLSIGVQSLTLSRTIEKAAEIDSLVKETMEAVRSFRDGTLWETTGLGLVATGINNPYYLALDSSVNPPRWVLQTGTEPIGTMTRSVIFEKVSRDLSTQNIESAYNASHDDPDTRRVIVTISYNNRNYQVVTYLTNWQNN